MKARARISLTLLAAALLAGMAAGLVYLLSDRFQEYARARLEAVASDTTGMDCRVGSLQFDYFRGLVEIRGLTLEPGPGSDGGVRVSVPEAHARVSLYSLLLLRPALAELVIVRPRVVLATGSGAGPWNPERLLRTFRKSFDIATGRASIIGGWLELDQKRVPLELSLRDFGCEVRYRAEVPGYDIHLAYREGHLLWAERDLQYDLNTRFTLSMQGLDFEAFEIAYRNTRLRGEGWMRDWASPALLLRLGGTAVASDLSTFAPFLSQASGRIEVLTNFRLDGAGVHSWGKFFCPAGSFRTVAFSSLKGEMEILRDILFLRDVSGHISEGSVGANCQIRLRSQHPDPNIVEVTATNMVIRDAARALQLPGSELENRADARLRASWRRGNEDLEVAGSVRLYPAAPDIAAAGKGTELQGPAEFAFGPRGWYLASAHLQSPHSDIEASGQTGPAFRLRARTSSLSEPLRVVRIFSRALEEAMVRTPDISTISGTYQLDGEVLAPRSGAVSYNGKLVVEDAHWRSYRLDRLDSVASWEGTELRLTSLQARRGTEEAEGTTTIGVRQDGAAPSRFEFLGKVRRVAIASLKEVGVDLGSDAGGLLSGTGSVLFDGSSWTGSGTFLVEDGTYRGEPFDEVRGSVRLDNGVLDIADGLLARGAAKVSLRGRVQVESGAIELEARLSDLPLREIPAVRKRKLKLDGIVAGSGQLRGTAANPAFKGSLRLNELKYESWDLGGGQGTVTLENRVLNAAARVESAFGGFDLHATVSTESGLPGKAVVEFRDWNVQRLIASKTPPFLSDISTALQGRVEIDGSFADPGRLRYSGELDGAQFRIHDYQMHNVGKIRFSSRDDTSLQIGDVRVLGEGSDLVLSGDIPLDSAGSVNLRLSGTANLALLERLERKVHLSGSTLVDVRATGTMAEPQVIGQAILQDARLDYADLPFHFSGVRGRVVFSKNLVRLENLEGAVATGTFQVSGAVEHSISEIRSFNLQVSVHRARVPYPNDFRSTVDAELMLRGTPDAQILTGDVNVLRSDYLRDFSLLEQLTTRGFSPAGAQATDPLLAGMRLNLSIHSDGGLYIENELTRLRGGMRLTLRGTPAYPSLTGRVEALEGWIFFRGNRFEIIRAGANFVDRNRINPVLDIRAEADVKSYSLLLEATGDLDHLTMNLSSDPPLSTVDIVSLLTTGISRETTTESSRRQAEVTGLSAASILSESLTGVIGKRVQRIFGFESFRVDPFLAGAEHDPTARVTITERISSDLAITFSRNLTTSEEQIVVLEYDVTRNMTIVATRDENGKFGLDFRFRKRFR